MNKFIPGLLCGAVAMFALQAAHVGAGLSASAAKAEGGQTCSRTQEAANRQFVASLKAPTPDTLYANMHDGYIQHNPEAVRFGEVNHVSGREAMKLLRVAFDKLGVHYGPPPGGANMPPPPGEPILVAECDMVASIRQMWMPDPQYPGKFYATYGFDLWRIKDGKLYEHWDDLRIKTPVPEYLKVPVQDLKPMALPAAPAPR